MTAPISLIPSEIWSKIFVFAVTDSSLKVGIDNPRFILTRVSSLWRTVALQTTELWSDIMLYAPKLCPESTIIKNVSIAKSWLERSGSFIPIYLDVGDYNYSWATYANLIRPYASRLHRLKISGYLTKALAGYNDKTPGKKTAEYLTVIVKTAMSQVPLSALEELVIVDYTVDRRGGRPRGVNVESLDFLSPRLKRLVVSIWYPYTFSQRIFPPQNNQLTHLFLSTSQISYSTWRYILKGCSASLECGAFCFRYPDEKLRGTYEEVILNRLTHLSLAPWYLTESLLDGIVCPLLQSFYICASTLQLNGNFLRIIAPVRRLCIEFEQTTIATQQEYGMLFMAAPLLEVFIISIDENPRNYKAMFDALMPTEIHDVVPRLTSLVVFGIETWGSDMFPIDRFIDFLDSRWKDRPLLSEADGTTCSLTDVQIHYHELEIQDDTRIALENFRKEGLRVILRSDEQFSLTWDDWLRLELEGMDWGKGIIIGENEYPDDLRKAMM